MGTHFRVAKMKCERGMILRKPEKWLLSIYEIRKNQMTHNEKNSPVVLPAGKTDHWVRIL